MRRRPWLVVALGLILLSAACTSSESDPAAYDPQGAGSCEGLADMFIGSQIRMLEALGTRIDAEMDEGDIPPEIQAAGEELGEWFYGEAGEQVAELCPGGVEESETYVCKDVALLEAQGEAGERHIRDNVPPCE